MMRLSLLAVLACLAAPPVWAETPGLIRERTQEEGLAYYRAYPLANHGYELIRAGKTQEATPYFARATALLPDHLPYRLQWVDLLIGAGDYDAARAAIAPALTTKKEDAGVLQRLAVLDAHNRTMPVAAPTPAPAAPEAPVVTKVVTPPPVTRIATSTHAPRDYCMALAAMTTRTAKQDMDSGYCAAKKGRQAEAIAAFENAASGTGDDAMKRDAYRQLASLYTAAGEDAKARAAGDALLHHQPQAEDYYYQALRLQKAGDDAAARTMLEQAYAHDKDNQLYRISLAYSYRAARMNKEALPLFDAAVKAEPARYDLHEDYAYTLKDESKRTAAAGEFRAALPGIGDAEKHYDTRREIQQLEDAWQTVGSATYRDGVARASGLPGMQDYNDTVQYGFESVYSPEDWQREGRRVQLYGQLFVSSDPGKANLNSRSTQGALGIRGTPLKETEWYVYAAKLVGIGHDAINDWQLRTTYAYTEGFDYDPNKRHWQYIFVTPDISYLVQQQEVYASIEGRYGRSVRAGNWVFTPHLVAAGAHQHSETSDVSADGLELGVGASIKYWFDETPERAPRGSTELLLQWREPVGNISDDKGGPFVRLVLQY